MIVQERRRLVRAGLARLLAEDRRGVEVVGVAADAAEVETLVERHRAELVIVELEPQGWDLGSLVGWLEANHPRTRVVALYRGRRVDHLEDAGRLGVGLVSYGSGSAGLRAAMRGRELPLPTGSQPERRKLPSRSSLDEREREVLRRMAAGETAEQSAKDLGLSARTVEMVQRQIVDKLGARGRAHAVAMAHRMGVLGAA